VVLPPVECSREAAGRTLVVVRAMAARHKVARPPAVQLGKAKAEQ
jgi:hypothetical protein